MTAQLKKMKMHHLPNGELYYTNDDVNAAVDARYQDVVHLDPDFEPPSPVIERLNLPVKSRSEIILMMNPGK